MLCVWNTCVIVGICVPPLQVQLQIRRKSDNISCEINTRRYARHVEPCPHKWILKNFSLLLLMLLTVIHWDHSDINCFQKTDWWIYLFSNFNQETIICLKWYILIFSNLDFVIIVVIVIIIIIIVLCVWILPASMHGIVKIELQLIVSY